jgi:carboxyl-terminal processing protease
LTGLFIERGPSVQIQGTDKRVHTEAKTYFSPYYDGPVVVLINRMSASASEIFAGALQDYNRAVIVGSDSFGKGTVQGLANLNHGKLKMTQSRFYRISGDSTQDRGVSPDIALPETYDVSLIGEASLEHAMKWDSIAAARYRPLPSLASYIERLGHLSSARTEKNADFIYVKAKTSYEDSMKLTNLSLNEKQRKALKESDKNTRLALENNHRKAKGEAPLSQLEEEDSDEEPIEDESAKGIDKDDAYLIEAANILVDFKELLYTEYLQLAK